MCSNGRLMSNLGQFGELVLRIRDPEWFDDDGESLPEVRSGWGEEILLSWFERHATLVAELHEVGRPEQYRYPALPPGSELLWELYRLGRLVDILIAPHQPVDDDPALNSWITKQPWWTGPLPSPSAWAAFCQAIGATVLAEDTYHPFFHEVVAVVPADDPEQPPEIVHQHWPGAMIGAMLLARAGVTVRTGSRWMDPVVATRSCLYWARWRRNRLVRDLSHGWGANSQWRTEFRRDYVVGDELHYNVDYAGAHGRKSRAAEDLPASSRHELLRVRHSLLTDLGKEEWPYYESFVERRPRAGDTVFLP